MGLKSAKVLKEAILADDEAGYVVLEKASERRVTVGVMYQPDVPDAHGEYASAEDLEDAVHDYMQNGDLRIRKQHDVKKVIGHVVGMMSWPFEQEVELKKSVHGLTKSKTVTLPAGTVYTAVKWSEDVWPDVKAGKIGGLSMGGAAVRIHG